MVDFQSKWDEFRKEGFQVLAASADSEDIAKGFADELGVRFPIGYGLDAEAVSKLTGAFYHPEKKFLHATGFLIRGNGEVEVAVYSTGPIGRFAAADVLMLAKYYKSQRA